ncbi:hypothetical protein GCM10023238_26990 [Streptomyces heliomycini]
MVGGTEYALDCLVFATGFSVGVSGVHSGRLPVNGRGGVQLLHALAERGPRSLHGFTSNGFPNLIQLGATQSASSVNYTHVLDEHAVHAAALVAARRSQGRRHRAVPGGGGRMARGHGRGRPDHEWFHAECTPGTTTVRGVAAERTARLSPWRVRFPRPPERWREESMDDVLVARKAAEA